MSASFLERIQKDLVDEVMGNIFVHVGRKNVKIIIAAGPQKEISASNHQFFLWDYTTLPSYVGIITSHEIMIPHNQS